MSITTYNSQIVTLFNRPLESFKKEIMNSVRDDKIRLGANDRPLFAPSTSNLSSCASNITHELNDTITALSKCTGNCIVTPNIKTIKQLMLFVIGTTGTPSINYKTTKYKIQ